MRKVTAKPRSPTNRIAVSRSPSTSEGIPPASASVPLAAGASTLSRLPTLQWKTPGSTASSCQVTVLVAMRR